MLIVWGGHTVPLFDGTSPLSHQLIAALCMAKVTKLSASVGVRGFCWLVIIATALVDRPVSAAGMSLEMSNTIKNAGTQDAVSQKIDGLVITFPRDDADVIELLLPTIAKFRESRRKKAKEEADAVIEAISTEAVREKLRGQIAQVLGLESNPGKPFDATYRAMLKDIEGFARRWEKWSGDLSELNFWNHATGESFKKEGRAVFPEISFGADPRNGKATQYSIRPAYLSEQIGIELIRPPGGEGAAVAVTPFRLDIPLFYRPGTRAERLAVEQRDFFETLPGLMEGILPRLVTAAAQALVEALFVSEIQTSYFTKEVSETQEGAMLIRGLARCYLLAYFKATGKLTAENEAQMLTQLVRFDVPEGEEEQAEFFRSLESLDPIAGKIEEGSRYAEYLSVAGSRMVGLTFIQLAQGGDEDGLPLLQKLRKKQRLPAGGFDSAARFCEAVESAYPAGFHTTFLNMRTDVVSSIKKKYVKEPAKGNPAPKAAPKDTPIPGRETQVFDGISITFPIALKAAMAKLGPELANLLKDARKRIRERFDGPTMAPVMVTDATLEMIRRLGLDVTRAGADFFSVQSAWLANANKALVRVFAGSSLQVWFRADLVAQLSAGREIPGFSYDPVTQSGSFNYSHTSELAPKEGESTTLEALNRIYAEWPAPVFPVILKDSGIADLTDVDEQVARILKEDTAIIPRLKASGSITPEQMGIQGSELPRSGMLTPAQALFLGVHEVVEAELVENVIASADRRWFCEGVANLLAMRACDEQFGKTGADGGLKVFESLYDPAALGARSRDVDLEAWPAVEAETERQTEDKELTYAHYYFTTRVLIAATKGRGDDFMKKWLSTIRETSRNRANAETIIAAYDKLTGESLRAIMKRTVSAKSR